MPSKITLLVLLDQELREQEAHLKDLLAVLTHTTSNLCLQEAIKTGENVLFFRQEIERLQL
jgi:hypothetical protein